MRNDSSSKKSGWILRCSAAAAWLLAACSGAPAEEASAVGSEASQLSKPLPAFYTLRPDLRRCAAPLCGGFFVKAVNQKRTQCADGSMKAECYVADLDLSALSLDPSSEQTLKLNAKEFLLRGIVAGKQFNSFGNLGTFVATEAYRGHAGATPSGSFFRANDNGTVCITFPCPSFTVQLLNSTSPATTVAGIDLSPVSADPSDGIQRLAHPEGLLLAASRTTVTGPAGEAFALIASEYYLPFAARKPPAACGSRGLPQCAPDQYCDFPAGANCGRADAPGTCASKPEICTKEFKPVCGCDGNTYSNACMAAASGVSVEFDGPCVEPEPEPATCGTIVGLSCEKGEFCDFGVGQCLVSDAGGVCRPTPENCLQIFDPVCGCDGKTYGNECMAHLAGAQIDHVGSCK